MPVVLIINRKQRNGVGRLGSGGLVYFKKKFYLPIRTQHNPMAYKTDRQIKVTRILNIILAQVTSQEMVSQVGKAYSAPLQPPHIEALRSYQDCFPIRLYEVILIYFCNESK